jgi:hypothetical protein
MPLSPSWPRVSTAPSRATHQRIGLATAVESTIPSDSPRGVRGDGRDQIRSARGFFIPFEIFS